MSPDRPTLLAEPEIRRIGEGLLDCSLPKPDWTHAAHCVACLYLMRRRPDIDLDLDLPGIIWRYNVASGTPNVDDDGYHETITRFYLRAARAFLARLPEDLPLQVAIALFLDGRFGRRDFPLDFWTREGLMSVEARRVWLAPDKAPLDFSTIPIGDSGGPALSGN